MQKMAENKEKPGNNFMTKLATFIVDKRNLFFLLTIIMLIFQLFPGTGLKWKVNFPLIFRKIPEPDRLWT